jgi:hypothetical protein
MIAMASVIFARATMLSFVVMPGVALCPKSPAPRPRS